RPDRNTPAMAPDTTRDTIRCDMTFSLRYMAGWRAPAVCVNTCVQTYVGMAGGGPVRAASEGDDHGRRAALGLAVMDRFDIVTVGVQHEGAVVAGMVFAVAGSAIVGAAIGQCGLVEGL